MRTAPMVAILLAAACHRPAPVPPARLPQSFGFTLRGQVLARDRFMPGNFPRVVVSLSPKWTARVVVRRLERAGDVLEAGDSVFAWCQVVGRDTVADSVRVFWKPVR